MAAHWRLWRAASAAIGFLAPDFPYTAVAITRGFVGSPHVDNYDITHQWTLSLGSWEPSGGGRLCVESAPDEVAVIDTRDRGACCDGRFPHWVSPYCGERYSVVWFATLGQRTAPQRFRPSRKLALAPAAQQTTSSRTAAPAPAAPNLHSTA